MKIIVHKTERRKHNQISCSVYSIKYCNSFLDIWAHIYAWLIQVDIYESRPFIGGKVGSFVDKRGNHIEMGLHVFFGCYNNLFRLLKKVRKTFPVTNIYMSYSWWWLLVVYWFHIYFTLLVFIYIKKMIPCSYILLRNKLHLWI